MKLLFKTFIMKLFSRINVYRESKGNFLRDFPYSKYVLILLKVPPLPLPQPPPAPDLKLCLPG